MSFSDKIAGVLFRLGLENIIDSVASRYAYRKITAIRSQMKHSGTNFEIGKNYIIKNPQYISVGNNFSALYNLRIEAWDSYFDAVYTPSIVIGNNVSVNTDCHIGCIDRIVIGDNVLMASRVYISDHAHGGFDETIKSIPPVKRPLSSKGPVIIEDNVWIGEGVCILPGVTIGKNSIIGANAVVNKSIPENSLAAGIPAKVIKRLS
jgi:acetyltransferase-like isoleucine patch superfamily enzyme